MSKEGEKMKSSWTSDMIMQNNNIFLLQEEENNSIDEW